MRVQIALGICMSFAVSVFFTQKTQVDITEAVAGKILKTLVQLKGAQAAKMSEKPTAHNMLLAHFFSPLK